MHHSRTAVFKFTEPCLKLDHSARETIGSPSEATGINNVGRGRGWYQWRQIQNIEDIEEIGANCELRSFSQECRPRQHEILAQRDVDGGIAGTSEDIAAAAARAKRCGVKLSRGIGKDTVDELLFARVGNCASKVLRGHVGAVAVPVPVRIGVATADQRGKWETRMLAHDSADRPSTEHSSHQVMAAAKPGNFP